MNDQNQRPTMITVALNPSLDRTIQTHFLAVGYQNRITEATQLAAASPPMNIARAAHQLGADVHVITVLGNDANGIAYEALIRKEGFEVTILPVEGKTRSRIIIYDTGAHKETEIIEEGQKLGEADRKRLADTLQQVITPGDYVIFAGRLGAGESEDTYAWLADVAQRAGARTAVAGGGEALADTLGMKPELVAITALDAEGMFNFPVRQLPDVISVSHHLQELGAQEVLIRMMDEPAAVLTTADGASWQVHLPKSELGTTSGSWEAFVAGYLTGCLQQRPTDQALSLGGAAAVYAASQVGVMFGSLEDVQSAAGEVIVALTAG